MRVLHVAETIKGGIATYLSEIVPMQIGRYGADNVRVLVPIQQSDQLSGVPEGCVVGFDRKNNRRGAFSFFNLWQSYSDILGKYPVDIIHLHSSIAGLLRLRGGAAGAKTIYCSHGWAFDREVSTTSRAISIVAERFLAGFCDKIVAISEHDSKSALDRRIGGNKIVVVENALSDVRPSRASIDWNSDRLKVLYIGRLDRQKGVDILFEAVKDLQERVSVTVVGDAVIAADGPKETPGNVKLFGWANRSQVESYLDLADVVVVPSRWEGFGLVALEAMRASRPVVATRVGGLQEIVIDGVTGILVEPANVAQLRDALRTADREALHEMGRRGRERFLETYLVERAMDRLHQTYINA